jgi:hypothetical protein
MAKDSSVDKSESLINAVHENCKQQKTQVQDHSRQKSTFSPSSSYRELIGRVIAVKKMGLRTMDMRDVIAKCMEVHRQSTM